MKRTPRLRRPPPEPATEEYEKAGPAHHFISEKRTVTRKVPSSDWTPAKPELPPHVRVDDRVTATVPWNKPELVTITIRHDVKPPRLFRVSRDPAIVLETLIDEEVSIKGKKGRELLAERIAPLF